MSTTGDTTEETVLALSDDVAYRQPGFRVAAVCEVVNPALKVASKGDQRLWTMNTLASS